MPNAERERATELYNILDKTGFDLQRLLEPGYQVVAVHTCSTVVTANATACAMFGYELDELIGLNAWLLFSPESAPILMEHLVKRSQEPYQAVARHKDGSHFRIELKGNNFMFGDEELRSVQIRKLDPNP